MLENPVTQDNLELLRSYGWEVISPDAGRLACGAVGAGKLPEPDLLLQHILRKIALPHDLGADAGQHSGGEHIVGQAMGQLGAHVGGGGGDRIPPC